MRIKNIGSNRSHSHRVLFLYFFIIISYESQLIELFTINRFSSSYGIPYIMHKILLKIEFIFQLSTSEETNTDINLINSFIMFPVKLTLRNVLSHFPVKLTLRNVLSDVYSSN